jgi:hypothetical protein
MRVPTLSVFLLTGSISAFAQSQFPPAAYAPPPTQLDEIRQHRCDIQVPEEGFGCAVLFDVGIPHSDGMIVSILGGDVRQVSVYLGGTLYTIAYDPPLKRDDKFYHLRRGMHVPVRIERNELILQWPDQTRSKGKIIQREAIFPNRPQPA